MTPDPTDVRAFVEAHREDLKSWTRDLVRAVTVNPPGDEHRAANVVIDFCDAHGIVSETFEKEPGRTNVVARIGRGRPRVLLGLHTDVVPAGDGWTTDPFDLVEEDGKLIGRGVMDDKGPLAASMLAALYLKQHQAELGGELILVAAADEESGSELGMKYLLAECGLEADLAIVPDAGHDMAYIDVGEKGVLFLEIRAVGRQAHGSEPSRGASAVLPVLDVLARLRDWRPPPTGPDIFTPPTLNIGAVHGGTVANMVPGKCEARLDIRYHPGTDGRLILQSVESFVQEAARAHPGVEMALRVLSDQPPTLLDIDHPLVERIAARTEQVTGTRPEPFGMSGATVAKFLVLAGTPAVGFICGPDGVPHTAGEWMPLEDLLRFAEVLTLVSWDLLELEDYR